MVGDVYRVQRPGGGNIGTQVGPARVLLVDCFFAPLTDRLADAIEQVTNADIRFSINSRKHGDHTGVTANLTETGVVIYTHENTWKHFLRRVAVCPR